MQNLRAGTFMPFSYPGSKEYAVNQILKMVPDHIFYAELFCGSAKVFLWKSIKVLQKSLSFQSLLNSGVAFREKSLRVLPFLAVISSVCKRIARFISLTKYICLQKYMMLTTRQFLPPVNGVGFIVEIR